MQYAELLITAPESLTDSFFDELKLHFTEAQIVEISYFVLTYNTMHRINAAVDLEPEDGHNLVIESIQVYSRNRAKSASGDTPPTLEAKA